MSRSGRPKNTSSPRRHSRGRLARLGSAIEELWQRTLEFEPLWIVLFLVAATWCLAPPGLFFTPRLEVGSIASRDYTASRELLLVDEEATRANRERARGEILPVYDYDPGIAHDKEDRLARLFAEGRDFLSYAPQEIPDRKAFEEELLVAVQTASELQISLEELRVLAAGKFSYESEERAQRLVRRPLLRGVVGNKSLLLENQLRGITKRNLQTGTETRELDLDDYWDPDEVDEFLADEIRRWSGLTRQQKGVYQAFLRAHIPHNLTYNRSETLEREEAAAAAVSESLKQVRKGQIIVRKGDEIDATAVRIMDELAGNRQTLAQILPVAGNFLLAVLVALILWLALQKETFIHERNKRVFGGTLLVLLATLLATKFCYVVAEALGNAFENAPFNSAQSYAYAIPFAALPLVTCLLYGRNAALLVAMMFSLITGRLAGDDATSTVIYCLAGSLAAIYSLEQLNRRSVLTRTGLIVGLVNMVIVLMLTWLSSDPVLWAGEVGFNLLCAFIGGLLVAAATSFLVPVLESLLSVTTDIKLLELSDTNLPLLQRLAMEAPGTFQHSLMVANLAKTGCEAIGSNPVFAYVGGLYHDIGKMFRPQYFIENQRPGENPHDKLAPSMSALIVINHVKEGLELAREYKLPQPICDAIEQHHGSRLLTYFYKRAEDQGEGHGQAVPEEKYRYPGPKPQRKALGVLMLADAIEAASRTLVDPTGTKIMTLVRKIIDDCLEDGQLDETDLTLGDLKRVNDAFLRVLATVFHRRIDYPGFDFNTTAPKDQRFGVVEGGKVS